VLTGNLLHGTMNYNLIGGLYMNELTMACRKLDVLLKSGIELDRQVKINQAWDTLSKMSYSKSIQRQKINNICKKNT